MLPTLARGCAVLGSGGGGEVACGEAISRIAIERHGPVHVVDLDELPADGLVLPCAIAGAARAFSEKLQSGDEARRMVDEIEALHGVEVVALLPLEIGGLNGVLSLSWAVQAGLPLIDADTLGRAFPLTTQTTLNLAGIAPSPCVITDERGNVLVIRGTTPELVERLLRSAVASLGGAAVFSSYATTVEQARGAVLDGAISRALQIGEAFDPERRGSIEDACEQAGGSVLMAGTVIDLQRQTTAGFARGHAIVEQLRGDDERRRLLRIETQNENLVVLEDGRVEASTPDVISVLDLHTGLPIDTDRLRRGQRVLVAAFPCGPIWRTPAGLRLAGPTAFGYALPYHPVGEAFARAR